ncbi:thioeseterase [Microbacterium nanhaiense]|uniref:Thioeseterase n=1 Tax=Microbacterium nanhaiense TaxID=1301026 RepID=A0ABQ2N4G6_9MICO|nr:thioesterase family protein [Microbacterium nanhaiense]GGO62708.1 thioeseterase [Microbacterium nanhaiense]
MNVLWRTLIIMLRAKLRRRREGTVPLDAVTRIRLTTLPTDIDLLRHMNNGRYLSLFDLGRWDMTARTGLGDAFRENGWYAVVANETITFRKSLELFTRFDIETRWIGHDEKALYMEHRAVVDGEVYARAIVRGRILRRSGGSVSHEELFSALGFEGELPEAPEWMHVWSDATRLPGTRRPAPSVWE